MTASARSRLSLVLAVLFASAGISWLVLRSRPVPITAPPTISDHRRATGTEPSSSATTENHASAEVLRKDAEAFRSGTMNVEEIVPVISHDISSRVRLGVDEATFLCAIAGTPNLSEDAIVRAERWALAAGSSFIKEGKVDEPAQKMLEGTFEAALSSPSFRLRRAAINVCIESGLIKRNPAVRQRIEAMQNDPNIEVAHHAQKVLK